jgi:hypothetical protein
VDIPVLFHSSSFSLPFSIVLHLKSLPASGCSGFVVSSD